jgi:hypothetical protein
LLLLLLLLEGFLGAGFVYPKVVSQVAT